MVGHEAARILSHQGDPSYNLEGVLIAGTLTCTGNILPLIKPFFPSSLNTPLPPARLLPMYLPLLEHQV